MNMRILLTVLSFLMCFSGIGSTASPLKVTTSNLILADMVKAIGGHSVVVTPIINASGCLHAYEPSTSDMKLVSKTEVYVKEGLGDDKWADRLIKAAAAKQVVLINAAKGIHLSDEHSEHAYFDLETALQMVDNIEAGLITARPSLKSVVSKAVKEYKLSLTDLRNWSLSTIRQYKKSHFICYSEASSSFVSALGLKAEMVVESEHEQDVSPKQLAKAVTIGRSAKVRAVLGDKGLHDVAKTLAGEIGCHLVLIESTVAPGQSFIETYRSNVTALINGLK